VPDRERLSAALPCTADASDSLTYHQDTKAPSFQCSQKTLVSWWFF
jgi:hypothetical protein